MNKYIVAYFNHFTSELKQELVVADTEFSAAISYLGWDAKEMKVKTMSDIKDACFDMDSMINVFDLNKKTVSTMPVNSLQGRAFRDVY